jgi:hypothetical protein
MAWKWLGPRLLGGTVAALDVALLVAGVSRVPFGIAAASLLFGWPLGDLIIEAIAARVPGERTAVVTLTRRDRIRQLGVWLAVSVLVGFVFKLGPVDALAVGLAALVPLGACSGS